MNKLTSRQRMLRALNQEDVDYIPCSFMSFTALRKRLNEDMFKLSKAELEMGLDSILFIPSAGRPLRPDHPDLRGLPVRFHPDVSVREWKECTPDKYPILHKEYNTPAGKLTTAVQTSDDWVHGDHIPFIDDYQIPRALKPLVTGLDELDALRYMLTPPSQQDIEAYHQEAIQARAFADYHNVLLVGGWGVGMDMVNWLVGMQQLMLLTMDNPQFVADLVELIYQWNRQRMEVVLSAPVDLYIRRAWYEGCDFVLPKFYRDVIMPRIRAEVDLAHERNAKFGYICSSGTKPMLDTYRDIGFDVLIGVDPIQGTHTDMPLMMQKLGGQITLWGGVSGAVTVERGTENEIRAAVRHGIKTLGPDGFILSPVDNITVDEPQTWRNVDIFIDEWCKCR
jgi:uroporphyrinogen-III decarboxylase